MRRMMGMVLAATCAAGCTNDPGFKGVPEVREARANEVTACRYISDITGTPSVYGPILGQEGLKYTRNIVLAGARDSGANTVVFEQVTPGVDVYELRARAYAC